MLLSFESGICTCNKDIAKDDKFLQYPHKVHANLKMLTVYFLMKYIHMVHISPVYFYIYYVCTVIVLSNKTTNLYFEVNDLKRT